MLFDLLCLCAEHEQMILIDPDGPILPLEIVYREYTWVDALTEAMLGCIAVQPMSFEARAPVHSVPNPKRTNASVQPPKFESHQGHFIKMASCPYSAEKQAEEISSLNQMPPPNQKPAAGQSVPLSTEREVSSIPMAGKYEGGHWIYPSEQVVLFIQLFLISKMFFNAMKRKNWQADPKDMMTVVPIHNAVNERCWQQILEWEKLADPSCPPKLVKFEGKPTEFTPKARFRQLMGYALPFDRHDWQVDRCGSQMTYVIDFYAGPSKDVPSFFLDVRPAMNWQGLRLRAYRLYHDYFKTRFLMNRQE
jgi:cytochrome c heme-lyase